MQQVGVEAVVEGLSAFIRDTGRLNSALDSIRPQGTLLQRAFAGITESLGAFGREILNVAEFSLGHLVADAIEFVVGKLKELISATIDAGAEFQTMQLRLNRLNLNTLISGGEQYNTAMSKAVELTKEQLNWIQKLAILTPYDAQDIANVFTLARSYGFAAKEAQGLTQDITNFAAGMGLGNVEIQRIMVNFGQMVQQGKVTQRELNDLARGAFVPVNDVLKQMQKDLGMTADELTEFRKKAESVPAFMKAFSEIVETRFSGAAQDMARTFKGATDNAQDFLKSIIGFNVVKPILDVIGGKIADMLSAFSDINFEEINGHVARFGTALARLLSDLLGGDEFDANSLVDTIVTAFDKMTTWINTHGDDVKQFFADVGTTINEKVVPFITSLVDNFNTIKDWVTNNGETISNFFSTLGDIIGTVFSNLTGGGGEKGAKGASGLDSFLAGVTTFMQFVIDNQDAIAQWATTIIQVVVVFQVLATILTVVGGIILGVIGFVLGLVATIVGLISIVSAVIAVLSIPFVAAAALVVAALGAVIATVILVISILYYFRDTIAAVIAAAIQSFQQFLAGVITSMAAVLATIITVVGQMRATFSGAPWGTIGRGIIEGVRAGVMHATAALIAAVVSAVNRAIQSAKDALGMHSPSTEGIYIGEMTIEGIAKGVKDNAIVAMKAMQDAVKMMAMPAMALPAITKQYAVAMSPSVNNNTSYTNNFNLTVNSGAPTEPIVQDYNMLKSLVSG